MRIFITMLFVLPLGMSSVAAVAQSPKEFINSNKKQTVVTCNPNKTSIKTCEEYSSLQPVP
ncbi:MAG: hypothetical protein PF589_11425 [Gammaproteobacteria bacterium]|jgi:hypothetical protein|nr:hypothetical protein [Gammaproteobacteria bacterium]